MAIAVLLSAHFTMSSPDYKMRNVESDFITQRFKTRQNTQNEHETNFSEVVINYYTHPFRAF